MTKLKDLKARFMEDPEFREEYARADEEYAPIEALAHVKAVADAFVGRNLFHSEQFNALSALAEHFKLLNSTVDHLAGLKALMPLEHLSATIANSLRVNNTALDLLRYNMFDSVMPPEPTIANSLRVNNTALDLLRYNMFDSVMPPEPAIANSLLMNNTALDLLRYNMFDSVMPPEPAIANSLLMNNTALDLLRYNMFDSVMPPEPAIANSLRVNNTALDLLRYNMFDSVMPPEPAIANSLRVNNTVLDLLRYNMFDSVMPPEPTIANSLLANNAALDSLRHAANLLNSFKMPDYDRELRHLTAMSRASEKLLQPFSSAQHDFADRLGVHTVTRSLVVRVVTTHDDVEDESALDEIWGGVKKRTFRYIDAVLPELSPELMEVWRGVWDAVHRRGPDWARQAGVSLRVILVDVLDAVAPVDALTDIPREYLHDGKPGRQAQVYWLCKPLQNRTYRRVARADLKAAISIIDAMSEAIHRRGCAEIEDAFDTLVVRAAIALCNLLKIWKARS